MKRYLLDLANAKLPAEWPKELTQVVLKDGVNQRDFDVEECDIPKDVYQKLLDMRQSSEHYNHDMPFGVNFNGITVGSVLTVLGRG